MAISKLTCPECQSVLKLGKPVDEGKKVKCPKCAAIFVAEDPDAAPAPKKKKAAAAKATPAKSKPAASDDDEGTYGVREEKEGGDEDQRRKAARGDVKDTFKKSARGPAQAAVTVPSNWLLRTSAFFVFFQVIYFLFMLFPIIFTEHHGVDARDVLRNDRIDDFDNWSQFKGEDLEKLLTAEKEDLYERILSMIGNVIAIIYGTVIVIGAVKMQNLESYAWAMTGSIMAIITLLALIPGIICIVVLRKPEIKAGFAEKSD